MFIFFEVAPAASGDPKDFIFLEMSMILYQTIKRFYGKSQLFLYQTTK